MPDRQNVLKAYKTCSESSKAPAHHLDLILESRSNISKREAEQKRNFSDVLRKKMHRNG
jgi:hypothetical protein